MPGLDRYQLNALKAKVSLQALMASNGVKTLRQGSVYKALCPFHEEQTPSVSLSVKKGIPLYHCFGCGKSGDALTFLQEFKQLSFPEAVLELQRFLGGEPPPGPAAKPEPEQPFPYELMARVAEVWHQAFCQRPEGLDYLEGRGLKDKEM